MTSVEVQKSTPELRQYLSVTQYLQDIYNYKKSLSPGFSYDAWSTEIGFKSRSFLHMIITQQRNISETFIEKFCVYMQFSETEKSYFSLLVSYNQAQQEKEKSYYLDLIFENLGKTKEVIEILKYSEFLESIELPKILVLLSFNDIQRNAQKLSEILKTDADSVQIHLEKLQDLGLAQLKEGQWVPTKKSFCVPKNFSSVPLENYHNRSLLEAIAAQKLHTDTRRFRSLLVPLSEQDYQNLLTEINSLVSKTLAKYDSDTLADKKLYKININLYPVTHK